MRYPSLKSLLLSIPVILCTYLSYGDAFNKSYFKKNLQIAAYPIDTEASAVILYEHVSVDLLYTNWHEQQTETVRRIIRIMKPDAINQANVSVFYPADNINNYVYDIQGTTYNMQNGRMEETDLPKADRFKEDNGNNLYLIKFLMPDVKEGSIIDYTYKIVSVAHNVFPAWLIQGKYPKLASEYELYYPSVYSLTTISHARGTPKECGSITELQNSTDDFCHFGHSGANKYSNSTAFWARKNIPAVKPEPFVTNISKEMERMEMMVTGFTTGSNNDGFINSWQSINDFFMFTLKIDNQISDPNSYLNMVVDSITRTDTNKAAIARSVYGYLRNNFKCTRPNTGKAKTLDEAFGRKEGEPSTLNLLLCAMLIHAGISATPILVSTTNNIPFNPAFPVMDRWDYLACAITWRDASTTYLDASDKNNCYGFLPPSCYNGFAWILGNPGRGTQLTNDMLADKEVTGVKMFNFTDSSAQLEIKEKIGLQRSIALRKTCAQGDKTLRATFKDEAHQLPSNIAVTECTVTNEDNPDTNLVVTYTGTMRLDPHDSTIYLTTTLLPLMKENPFKAEARKLPIEFTYPYETKYFITLMLPPTYEPDTLPQPLRLDFEKGNMEYKRVYSYSPQAHILTMSSNYNLNKSTYPSTYYDSIRELFGKITSMNNEIITLKKTTAK